MQFVHPSIKLETSNSTIQEFMDIMEGAGRTCWQSNEKAEIQIKKLLEDPEFDPDTYEGWHTFTPHPQTGLTGFDGNPGNPKGQDWVARTRLAAKTVNNKFLKGLVKIGHTSVLEHSAITVRFITDRAVTHQLVRHRIAAYSQESQRYVDYMNDEHIMFIIPEGSGLEPGYYGWDNDDEILYKHLYTPQNPQVGATKVDIKDWAPMGMPRTWVNAMQDAEESYQELRSVGVKAQDARSVLPNATKTEIVATFNIPMWRHVMEKRLDPAAQHDIRHLMGMVLDKFMETPMAILFEDLT